jgi:hypothetical protein
MKKKVDGDVVAEERHCAIAVCTLVAATGDDFTVVMLLPKDRNFCRFCCVFFPQCQRTDCCFFFSLLERTQERKVRRCVAIVMGAAVSQQWNHCLDALRKARSEAEVLDGLLDEMSVLRQVFNDFLRGTASIEGIFTARGLQETGATVEGGSHPHLVDLSPYSVRNEGVGGVTVVVCAARRRGACSARDSG